MEFSGLAKRLICLGAVAATGAAAAAGYGYYLEHRDSLEVLAPVTPVASADSETQEIVDISEISFSHNDTFYSESFAVELKARDENAEIYYTLDGSDPDESSDRYTQPLSIKAGDEVTATTIKAISVSGENTSEVITKSYVTGWDVFERFSEDTYVFVLSADPYDLYDYENGIAVEGKIRDEWLENEWDGKSEVIPTDPANWNQEGMAGERPMYMELFDSRGNMLFAQQAGARVAGAYSRSWPQKSWKLIARTSYTPENGMFRFSFFDDADNADGMLLTKYDRITLRNGANDREHGGIREELSASLAKQAGYLDVQSTAPAAVFLNGKYYGFAWLHQTFCKGYLETRYGGEKDNFQIVGKAEGDIDEENAEGAADDYNKMLEFARGGLTDDKRFEEFCTMLDIDNYMRYLAIQLFIDNRDWPGNNYKAWRYCAAEGEETGSEYLDGRWRYLLFDVEFAWGLYSDGFRNATLSRILNDTHPGGGSVLMTALLEREDMREKLANNICDLIGGAFSTDNILKTLEELEKISDPEQFYALDRGITSTWANRGSFENSRNEIRQFAKARSNIILKDLRTVFGLDEQTYKITVKGENGLKIMLNTLRCEYAETVSADYFLPYSVQLSAEGYSGYAFDHWEINGSKVTDSSLILDADMAVNGEITVTAHGAKTVADVPLYISEVYTSGGADWIELYNPNDTAVSTKGMYLSDDEMVLNKWAMPAINIKAGEAVVVVCKNNKDPSALLKAQTNFNLKAGEILTLSDASGRILGRMAIADCDSERSQLRQTDGSYKESKPTMGSHSG